MNSQFVREEMEEKKYKTKYQKEDPNKIPI